MKGRGLRIAAAVLALVVVGGSIGLVYAKAKKKPNLVVIDVDAAGSVAQGQALGVSDTVRNRGKKTAKASETGYFVSTNATKDAGDVQLTGTRPVPALKKRKTSASAPGFEAEVPTLVEPGDYFVIACADVENIVKEKPETDNCKATAITVEVTDGISPTAPTLDEPAGPSNDETPTLTGDAEPDSTVTLYKTNNCTGPSSGTDVADAFGEISFTPTVTENASASFTARATDQAGNTGDCSDSITYVEDSTAPAAPSGLATNPVSPANDTTPHITGTAEAGSTVNVHTTDDCSSPVAGTGTATGGTFDIEVTVPEGSAINFAARAADAAGNASACSAFVSYVEQGDLAEVEPNNSITDANAQTALFPTLGLSADKRISAAISEVSDADIFRITAAPGAVARFEVLNGGGLDCDAGVATVLDVLEPGGTSITSDASRGLRNCSAITREVPAGGSYVRVEDEGANGFIPSYQLRAEFFSDGGAESEPNDNHGSADSVGNQAFIQGNINNQADLDVYAITVPDGASVRAEVIEAATSSPNFETCESNNMDTYMELLDPAGNVLIAGDDSGRGRCSMIDGRGDAPDPTDVTPPLGSPGATDLDAGTYYARVAPYPNSFGSAYDYRLAVSIE